MIDKNTLDKIVVAIDKVFNNFKKDEESIFPNDTFRTDLKFENVKEILGTWHKSKVCIYKGCKEKSILKSHTIQRSPSLRLIAENNHVTTIKFNTKSEKLAATKVGINIASTFPGFCKKHESLFSDFEAKKELVTAENFTLQLYRTVCREIVNTNYYIDIFEKRKKQYLSFRNKKIGEHLIEELGADFLAKHKINIGNVRLAYRDYKANFLDQEIKKLREYLNGFLLKFQDGILNDIHTKKNRKIHILVINLDIEIPLCLAGRGNFQVANNSEIKDIDTILNVLPYPNKTFIVAAVLSKNKSELDFYIDRFSNSLEAVNMVESWMIHGSDHWFIKPSVWDKIQRQFKNEMINDIYDFSKT